MFQRWLFWPLFAALTGFAVGGSLVWSIHQPDHQQATAQTDQSAEQRAAEHQPAKSFGERVAIIWDRTFEDAVAFYTFVLGIFTAALAIIAVIQIYFLNRADKTARISADAAKAAADSIVIVERPYIFIWGIMGSVPTIEFHDPGKLKRRVVRTNASFAYSVSNRGKLAAVIENISVACGYLVDDQYPPLIVIGDHSLLRTPIVSPDEDIKSILHDVPWRDLDPTNRESDFRDGLSFRVVVAYRGPFTRGHETSQCWRYAKSVNGFAEVTDEQYTYSR